jgi:hypothetical protein
MTWRFLGNATQDAANRLNIFKIGLGGKCKDELRSSKVDVGEVTMAIYQAL